MPAKADEWQPTRPAQRFNRGAVTTVRAFDDPEQGRQGRRWSIARSAAVEQEGNDCQDDADDREDLSDVGGILGQAAKAEDGSDDGDDEEDDGPIEHERIF